MLVRGGRTFSDRETLERVLDRIKPGEIIHGGIRRGHPGGRLRPEEEDTLLEIFGQLATQQQVQPRLLTPLEMRKAQLVVATHQTVVWVKFDIIP